MIGIDLTSLALAIFDALQWAVLAMGVALAVLAWMARESF